MVIRYKHKNKDEHIVGFSLLFGLFMPNGSLFYILTPMMVMYLAWRYFIISKTTAARYLIILSILISFILFAFISSETDISKSLLRNISIVLLLLLFPFVTNTKLPNIYLYIALSYIFISQISYMIGVKQIISFFNDLYPYEGERTTYQSDYLESVAHQMSLINRSLRLGGLYKNSNQCAKYLTLILASFMIENYKKTFKQNLPFLILFSLSIIATGSRTGFFITLFILIYFFYIKAENKDLAIKLLSVGFILVVISSFLFLATSGYLSNLRFLDYEEGLDKSLLTKISILANYISSSDNILTLLFGNFTNDGINSITFDSEWGESIYRYGIISVFAFAIFYISVFKTLSKKNRIIFITLLWAISSTMILSFRASFVFMLLLSKYYSEDFISKYYLKKKY